MGDMADWLLGSADWDNGLEWDEYEDLPYIGCDISRLRGPQPKRCKFCGEYPLYWHEMWPHHWRLRRSDGTPHRCDHTPKTGRLLQDLRRRLT